MMQAQEVLLLSLPPLYHQAQHQQCLSAHHFLTLPALHRTAQHSLPRLDLQAASRLEQSLSTPLLRLSAPAQHLPLFRPSTALQMAISLLFKPMFRHSTLSTLPQVSGPSSSLPWETAHRSTLLAVSSLSLSISPFPSPLTFPLTLADNALDNTLYGVQNTSPAPRIIRIGADGTVVGARTLPVAPGAYNAGDVDENGEFWVAYQGKNWVHLRLSDQTIIDSGTATFSFSIYDWAYVPGGGNFLYAIAVDGSGRTFLYRFDRTNHTWAQVGAGYGAIYPANGVVGAVYASQDGFLYGSENTQGKTYKFSLDGNTSTFIIQGPTASSNDGAHCINNGAGV